MGHGEHGLIRGWRGALQQAGSRMKPLLACVVVALTAACSTGSATPFVPPTPATTEEAAFATAVPVAEMNTRLTLRLAPEYTESTTIGSGLALWAENQSDEWIKLPSDLGVSLFSYSQESAQWEPLEDYSEYVSTKEPLLAPHEVFKPETGEDWQVLVRTSPRVEASTTPVVVRVVVVGNVYRDGEVGEPVSAYVDITLQP